MYITKNVFIVAKNVVNNLTKKDIIINILVKIPCINETKLKEIITVVINEINNK
jgi:hypothetical protein